MTDFQIPEELKIRKLFDFVQCYAKVPENFRANFVSVFENTFFSKNVVGNVMKMFAREERIMSQPRKMLISSFTLQNRTPITPLLLF